MKNLKITQYLMILAITAAVAHLLGSAHGVILAAAFIGWVDANVGGTPQKRGQTSKVAGAQLRKFAQSWVKATTDGNGTLYFIAEAPSDAVMVELTIANDALAGCTSVDAGVYKIDKGLANLGGPSTTTGDYAAGASATGTPNSTPVDAGAVFMSAKDISAGITLASKYDALTDNLTAQTVTTLGATAKGKLCWGLKLWELLGFTDPKWKDDSYVIGFRLNTAGSATGNLAAAGSWLQG